jgi:hypothetical protein
MTTIDVRTYRNVGTTPDSGVTQQRLRPKRQVPVVGRCALFVIAFCMGGGRPILLTLAPCICACTCSARDKKSFWGNPIVHTASL